MKCSPIRPNVVMQFSRQQSFKNRNIPDYSKDYYDKTGDKNKYFTREIQHNKYGNVLGHTYKYYENGKMTKREFYTCRYHDNGKLKYENFVEQDFKNRVETRTLVEYSSSCSVTNYAQSKKSF